MTNEFQLFPDIKLVYSETPVNAGKNEMMICCCVSGVCEYHTDNGYFYLNKETIIALGHGAEYKTGISDDFRGIFLMIDYSVNSPDFSELFGISSVLRDIRQREVRVYQSDSRVQKLLEAILAGADKSLTTLMRLKMIELFMILGESRPKRKSSKKSLQIGEFICNNISEHYTISQLSELFSVNQTTLKSDFRRTFGCGIYSYIKKRKVFRAAELLLQTNMKIIDIAEEVGYCNASKFANAFQSVMGVTPKYFRMEHNRSTSAKKRESQPAIRY